MLYITYCSPPTLPLSDADSHLSLNYFISHFTSEMCLFVGSINFPFQKQRRPINLWPDSKNTPMPLLTSRVESYDDDDTVLVVMTNKLQTIS